MLIKERGILKSKMDRELLLRNEKQINQDASLVSVFHVIYARAFTSFSAMKKTMPSMRSSEAQTSSMR